MEKYSEERTEIKKSIKERLEEAMKDYDSCTRAVEQKYQEKERKAYGGQSQED